MIVGPPEQEMLESWTSLAFVAGRTSRIKLGVLVTGVTYRYPGILIKTATTLDVLSQGRSYFGIGAAWNEEEHHALGVPFPTLTERFERLEEMLQIALRMWSGDEQPYEGKHYQLARPLNSPQTAQHAFDRLFWEGRSVILVTQYLSAGNGINLQYLPSPDSTDEDRCDFAIVGLLERPYYYFSKPSVDATDDEFADAQKRISGTWRNSTLAKRSPSMTFTACSVSSIIPTPGICGIARMRIPGGVHFSTICRPSSRRWDA